MVRFVVVVVVVIFKDAVVADFEVDGDDNAVIMMIGCSKLIVVALFSQFSFGANTIKTT